MEIIINSITWDENFFEESGLYIWIYNNGLLESSNEKTYEENLPKIYYSGNNESLNNNNEREIK